MFVLPKGLRDRDARLPQPESDAGRNEAPPVDRSRSGCAVTLDDLAAEQPRLLISAVARASNHQNLLSVPSILELIWTV